MLLFPPATESAFIDEVWQVPSNQFLDFGNGLLKTFLGGARDMKVKGGILENCISLTGVGWMVRYAPLQWPGSCQDSNYHGW